MTAVPDDVLRQTVEALAEHGSQVKAAKALGISRGAFQQRLINAEAKGLKAPDGYRIKGTSTLYDVTTGEAKLQWVKTTEDQAQQEARMLGMVEGFKSDLPKFKRATKPEHKTASHLLNLIPMGDPHFGLLCWAKEVGEAFDLDIASRDMCAAVDHLVSQAAPADRCIIANMGDFFHVDNLEGLTPASRHSLDVDSRLPKIMEVGILALRQAITTALTRHKTVEVINCRANHDPVLGLALSVFLAHVYENEPRVIVHSQPTFRHYVRHGKVLLGFVHGDKTNDRDLSGIMATERAEDWGLTKHRYFFRGHHHHLETKEYNGCIVEQVRTLAPSDAYSNGAGFLSGRDMKLITYHADCGEQKRVTCGIDLLRSLAA